LTNGEVGTTDQFAAYQKIQETLPELAPPTLSMIPGAYRFIILLKNSVVKEFSIEERDIVWEEDRGARGMFGPNLRWRL
jgi:hypothetical protein